MSGTNHLSNEEFFNKLTEVFEATRTKNHGSIYLIQKRLTYADGPQKDEARDQYPVLIRASNGKHGDAKSKLSTIVEADALDGFFARYTNVCKQNMVGLKPRDRSKKKAKAKKKKIQIAS